MANPVRPTRVTPETWWLSPDSKSLAHNLTTRATAIETASIAARWRSLVFWRYMAGRPQSATFAYGMARRPTSFTNYYGSFVFRPPSFNLCQIAGRVYTNRLLRHNVALTIVPERGDYKQTQLSQDFEDWLDGAFDELGFWSTYNRHGQDMLTYGSGFIKTEIDRRSDKDKCIRLSAPHPDELLVDNIDEENPDHLIQRCWGSRSKLMQLHQDNPDAVAALAKTQSAFPAFWFSGLLQVDDVIPYLEAWYRDPSGGPGRHVKCVNNYVFEDRKYEQDYPDDGEADLIGGLVRTKFSEAIGGFFGQGLTELLLPLNESIDELMAQITLAHRQTSFNKWLVEESSAVNPNALGDTMGAIAKYTGVKPELVAYPAVAAEVYQHLEREIRFGLQTAQLSDQAIAGETPKALSSAVALEKYVNINDANFAELGERLEETVEKTGYQLLRAAKVVKPSVKLVGRDKQLINWDQVEYIAGKPVGLKAFGINRLSQDPAGAQQKLDDMLGKGTINRRIYSMFSAVPDMGKLQDRININQTSTEKKLDDILRTGKYKAPSAYCDLDYAKSAVEDRILLEEQYETPEKFINLLRMWRSAVVQLIRRRDSIGQAPSSPLPASGPAPEQTGAGGPFGSAPTPTVPNPVQGPAGLPGAPVPVAA